MENIYGLNHTLGMSNINDSISMQNRNIAIANENTRNTYINDVAKQKKAKSDSEGDTAGLEQSQEGTDAKTAVSSGEFGKIAIPALFKKIPLVKSNIDPSAVTILADPNNTLGTAEAVKAGEDAKGVPVVQATEVSEDVLQAGSGLAKGGEDAISEVKGLSGFAKAGAVLEAGEGALAIGDDISLDIKTGKFDQIAGNNDWEKVSNVSDIAGGAAVTLLGIGTVLDASIVGAPVGLALQGLAAAAGIVSGITDYIGEQKEKSEVKPPPAAVKAPPSSVAPVALQATGTSGQEVRVN